MRQERLESAVGETTKRETERRVFSPCEDFDLQTGLLSHQAIQDAVAGMVRSRPAGREVALIWIDLLNLRREFSLWGWAGADALTRRVAGKLRSVVDSGALLGRVGGRSFLVAMEASKHNKASRRQIQAVVDALAPVAQRGSETRPQVSAGVAFFPVDTDSVEDLARFASLAAARAERTKSKSVVAFHAGMDSTIAREHALESEMRTGLETGQFSLAYQPKVDLASGEIMGAEALVRWAHPERGPVFPAEFIPVAERSDLIHEVFEFVFRAALEQVQRWDSIGVKLPLIAVNVSPANARAEGFVSLVAAVLEDFHVGSTEVELEMTGSFAPEEEELFITRMGQLKKLGVRIAIDGFGSRHTGFNVLKHLPLNTMKIDRSFIRGIDHSPGMRSICQTIVSMARQLKLRIVAEGIEERGELEVMRELGCEAGQGYLFERPLSPVTFAQFLREWEERRQGFCFLPARLHPQRDALSGSA